MIRCTSYIVLILALVTSTVQLCPARADDAEGVKEKLFQAKKEYDSEVQKFKQSVQEVFDKREEVARAAGDKKAVDQVKAEREAFTKSGELPATLAATVKQRVATARTNLDKAYTVAIKEYLRLKADAAADATNKERNEFLASTSFLVGKPTDPATKEELYKCLVDTSWEWGDGLRLRPNGVVEQRQWSTSGLVTKWVAVDRRTVVLVIEKGRAHNRTATLTFKENLTEFNGFDFSGERLETMKKKP